MSQQRPTKKQRELLTFVENFIAGHGYGPSYREIMSGMGYSSVATVAKHVENLIARGHLNKKDNSARSLEIVKKNIEEPLPIRGAKPSESEEKWLIKKIDEKFAVAEEASPVPGGVIDDLSHLVGALGALGFDGAQVVYRARLKSLRDSITE